MMSGRSKDDRFGFKFHTKAVLDIACHFFGKILDFGTGRAAIVDEDERLTFINTRLPHALSLKAACLNEPACGYFGACSAQRIAHKRRRLFEQMQHLGARNHRVFKETAGIGKHLGIGKLACTHRTHGLFKFLGGFGTAIAENGFELLVPVNRAKRL